MAGARPRLPAVLRRPSSRLTNLTLLATLLVVFTTGFGSWLVGTAEHRWVVIGHGIAGLLVVLLAPWKTQVARTGFARRRRTRWASLTLAALAVGALATGVLHSTGLATAAGGQLMMWWHVAFAFALVPLLGWHALARRQRFRRTDVDRRLVLRTGALTAGAGAAWLLCETTVRAVNLPGAQRRFTGSYEFAAPRPTIWLSDSVPEISDADYLLRISGTGSVRELGLAELREHATVVRAVIDCTSGWYSEQDWTGAPLTDLLGDVGAARSITVRSVTGYWRRFAISDAPSLLMAHSVAGEALPVSLGAPVRLVVPGRRGFWWVKWVDRIEVDDTPPWWQPTFPLQ